MKQGSFVNELLQFLKKHQIGLKLWETKKECSPQPNQITESALLYKLNLPQARQSWYFAFSILHGIMKIFRVFSLVKYTVG